MNVPLPNSTEKEQAYRLCNRLLCRYLNGPNLTLLGLRGHSTTTLDQILPNFNPTPLEWTVVDFWHDTYPLSVTWPSVDFLRTPYPPLLVHVVIEWPFTSHKLEVILIIAKCMFLPCVLCCSFKLFFVVWFWVHAKQQGQTGKWYFVTKIVQIYCEKKLF